MSDYQLWHVTYRYETPGDFPRKPASDSYFLIAQNPAEARTKADILFRHESGFKRDLLKTGGVERNIRPYSAPLNPPKLSVPSDKSVFTITPAIKDGRLEFLVKKHEGK